MTFILIYYVWNIYCKLFRYQIIITLTEESIKHWKGYSSFARVLIFPKIDCHPFSDKIWWLVGRVDCLTGLRPTEYCKGSIKWLHRSQLRGVQWQYSGVAQDKTGGERRVSLLCSVCLGKLAWSSSVWGWDTASVVCQAETGKLSIDSQDSQTALRQAGKELWYEEKIKTLISWETSSSNNAINVEK